MVARPAGQPRPAGRGDGKGPGRGDTPNPRDDRTADPDPRDDRPSNRNRRGDRGDRHAHSDPRDDRPHAGFGDRPYRPDRRYEARLTELMLKPSTRRVGMAARAK
jgi:hypothetical protein